jgi:uncharacterized membrane protein
VEALIVLLVLGLAALMLIVPIFTFIAYARTNQLRTELEALKLRLKGLEARGPRPAPVEAAPAAPAAPASVPVPAAVPEKTAVVPPPSPPSTPARASLPPMAPPAPRPDLATNLGPKLLVGFGALAVFVAMAFFVKYAWDNDWVGPTGRVLFGLVVSLGMVASGLRLMGKEYRPLGQGLAGAGFAGLYVSTFGAHAFYNLIPREAAGLFLLGVTTCAILIALRLDARLLSALAWLGAYLTPVLLSSGKDQAVSLFAYLFVLGAGAVAIRRRKDWPETAPLALLGTVVLYVGWAVSFYKPGRFAVAAAGLVLLTALFSEVLPAATLLLAGAGAVALTIDTDRPATLTCLLVALAAVAMVRRTRFALSEAVTILASWVAIAVWLGQQYGPERLGEALLLAVGVAGVYFLALAIRGLLVGEAIGAAGLATHMLGAGLLWSVLYRAFYETNPSLLGGLSVALAAVYLVLGLGLSRREDREAGHLRAALGLAAGFVTVAIPVQLGLNGITLGWALEGLLLLGLGLRFQSQLTRAAGYAVLALAVLRLLARHLPLHDAAFAPFVNASFGTWLFVIVSLAVAARLVRAAAAENEGLDGVMRPLLGAVALLLLFGVLTGETQALFAQRAATADADGLADVAQRARLAGRLAISVLWSVFAITLLAAGLVARSRALFWTAYALFAVAGLKVAFVDLAELHTLYRILSFLALGVLLMLGAYVNLRFRDRLSPRAEA